MIARSPSVIDCDVHAALPTGLVDLLPYMPSGLRRHLGGQGKPEASEAMSPQSRTVGASRYDLPANSLYINSAGPVRDDSSPDGSTPGSSPAVVAQQLLDRYGVWRAILVGGNLLSLGAFPNPDIAAGVASAYNDWLQENWLDHDPRYRGAVVIAPQDPEAAVNEIERVSARRGVAAIFVPLHKLAMGERFFYPIYRAAEEHALPILVHPSGTESVLATAPQMAAQPTYYIEWHTVLGQIHQSNVVSLVCHGVFERFPKLLVIVAEGGFMWTIETMLRLDRNWIGLRDEVPWLKDLPSEYVRRHIRFTTQPFVEVRQAAHLEAVLEMADASTTLMFSSDYPHWDFDDPNRALAGLPEALRHRILFENARAAFGSRLD